MGKKPDDDLDFGRYFYPKRKFDMKCRWCKFGLLATTKTQYAPTPTWVCHLCDRAPA